MGEIFPWKEEYNTGCEEIDTQHKKLFNIINELFTAFEGSFAESQVPRILKELEDYTVYHFSTEERLFEERNYPLKEEHKKEHDSFIRKIKNFKKQMELGQNNLLAFDVMLALKDWLIDHILGSDHKYIPYLCND